MTAQKLEIAQIERKLDLILEALRVNFNSEPLILPLDILSDFKKFMAEDKGLAKYSVSKYSQLAKHFIEENKVITRDTLNLWLSKEKRASTFNAKLEMIFNLVRDFQKRPDLTEGLDFKKVPYKIQNVPTLSQVQKFYGFLEDSEIKPFYLSLATSGLRYSEILTLRVSDINQETLLVRPETAHSTNRTKRANFSFITPEAFDSIKPLLLGKNPSDRIFSLKKWRIWLAFDKARRESGIKLRVKDLRSFWASYLIDNGMPESSVDFCQGRLSASVLRRHYLDYSEEKMFGRYGKASDSLSISTQKEEIQRNA